VTTDEFYRVVREPKFLKIDFENGFAQNLDSKTNHCFVLAKYLTGNFSSGQFCNMSLYITPINLDNLGLNIVQNLCTMAPINADKIM